MTSVATMMVFRKWEGSDAECFSYEQMNRISANVKALADMVGVTYTQITVQQKDFFRYDYANALEKAIKDVCATVGIEAPMETDWNKNRSVSYVDFERMEKYAHQAYRALHGEGNRIPWNKDRKYDMFTLYADNWEGTGPYTYALPSTFASAYADGIIFARPEASDAQKAAEFNALLSLSVTGATVQIVAHGIKPKINIPIAITRGRPKMNETKTLALADWTGTGPWKQTVTFTNTVATGVATISEGATDAQAEDFAKAGISVSAVSGTSVTFRSVLAKPTMDLPVLLIYESSESA